MSSDNFFTNQSKPDHQICPRCQLPFGYEVKFEYVPGPPRKPGHMPPILGPSLTAKNYGLNNAADPGLSGAGGPPGSAVLVPAANGMFLGPSVRLPIRLREVDKNFTRVSDYQLQKANAAAQRGRHTLPPAQRFLVSVTAGHSQHSRSHVPQVGYGTANIAWSPSLTNGYTASHALYSQQPTCVAEEIHTPNIKRGSEEDAAYARSCRALFSAIPLKYRSREQVEESQIRRQSNATDGRRNSAAVPSPERIH
ncbi:hypothetical protein NM688_g5592 [Phlebia brevispora]|uniref:Uncharacterized protein n=1 Tax=Phlebia brevispora TaxID=194682 RepID=A0ACC1ST00_9APHY|nr:hypothetical protein NM688_g5592 [Phlebia brevispora]